MKIVVYNYKDQFALSRHEIELLMGVLSKDYFAPIAEFHLTYDTSKPSAFEYSYETKIAYFAYPIKEKTAETVALAVKELLVGLARIKARSKFGETLKDKERAEYLPFLEMWNARCLSALGIDKAEPGLGP